jgi:predicted Rossmann-fold nucleotide-binding protein
MRITADVAHQMTKSIAIRARVEGRVQATNDLHSLLLTLDFIDLRQAGLLADNDTNIFYPGGGGTHQEALHHSNSVRNFVNLDGYWDPFRAYLEQLADNGLMTPDERGMFRFLNHPLEALAN